MNLWKASFVCLGLCVFLARGYARVHSVRAHDTLWSIARKYKVSVQALLSLNHNLSATSLLPGMSVMIPRASSSYRVKQGDTLYSIAQAYSVSVDSLKNANALQSNVVYEGQQLSIPQHQEVFRVSLPVRGEVLQSFGMQGKVYSSGLLLKTDQSQLVSSAQGTVIFVGFLKGYGTAIMIEHESLLVSFYASYDMHALVKVGHSVQQGASIATLKSHAPNPEYVCHFQLWHNGYPVDPNHYVKP